MRLEACGLLLIASIGVSNLASGQAPGAPLVRENATAKIAAHTSWANTEDRAARTAAARKAAHDRFAHQVDPNGVLPPEERAKRADNARRAYFTRLAMLSARARRARTRGTAS